MKELKLAMYIALRLEGYSPGKAIWITDQYFSKFNRSKSFA